MHAPDEKRKKLDAKSKKCILVGYLNEKKGYKFYNPQTKQVQVIRDVLLDKLTSWYSLLSLTPDESIPTTKKEANVAKMVLKEEEINLEEEKPISFKQNGPNGG